MNGKKPKMLTPRQYAERQGVAYTTVMNWLRQDKILGAVKQMTPTGHYWEIPAKAAKPKLQTGRPRTKKAEDSPR
jgi:predicted site-specific integrase-resolvase